MAHTITREPGGTAVGEGIRKILLTSETIHLTAASELLLFYASRSQNIQEKIKPALDRNEMVICDRYYHASMAYQGYGRGIPLEGRFEGEDLDFYNKVRDGYLELASEDERIQLIYADRPIEAVHRHILTLLGFER